MDAFIFDMDGVIVDSEYHWKSLEGYFLKSLIPGWDRADQGKIIGLSQHDLYALLVSDYGLRQPKEQFQARYFEMARQIYGRKVALIAGFSELLFLLTAHNVPLALASSSPTSWIDIVLDRFDLRAAFREVVSADELLGEGKPSPAIYLLTAQRLHADPRKCVVVEDSCNGVLSARSAGMLCIGLRNGFNDEQDLSAANFLVDDFAALTWRTLSDLTASTSMPAQAGSTRPATT